jgi:hypothetical protein
VQGIIQFGENSALAGEWQAVGTSSSAGDKITIATRGANNPGGEIVATVASGSTVALTGRSAESVIVALGDTITVTGTIDIAPVIPTDTRVGPIGGTIALIGSGKGVGRGSGVLVLKGGSATPVGKLSIGSGTTPITSIGTTTTSVQLTDKNGAFPAGVTKDATSPAWVDSDPLEAGILATGAVATNGVELGSIAGVANAGAIITGPAEALATSTITSAANTITLFISNTSLFAIHTL